MSLSATQSKTFSEYFPVKIIRGQSLRPPEFCQDLFILVGSTCQLFRWESSEPNTISKYRGLIIVGDFAPASCKIALDLCHQYYLQL